LQLLASLASKELWGARTRDLNHEHFTTLGAAPTTFPAIGEATGAKPLTGAEYWKVLRLTLSFLDAFVKPQTAPFGRLPALPVERIPRTP
jgi:hypothetical protein